MATLRIANPEKAAVNNSTVRALGVSLFLEQITKAEPFQSLYLIKPEILAAIRADMAANGFDPSKPVNVWKRDDGSRILIDGYTRIKAAEELGLLTVVAHDKTFENEEAALAYAIHTQKDRRNLTDGEILNMVEKVHKPVEGFKASIAQLGANGQKPKKTAEITAEIVGATTRQVEKVLTVLKYPEEAAAVRAGVKSINRAAKDTTTKHKPSSKSIAPKPRPKLDDEQAPEVGAAGMIQKWYSEATLPGYRKGLKDALDALDTFHVIPRKVYEVIKEQSFKE